MQADRINLFIESHARANIFQTMEMFQVYLKSDKHEPVQLIIEDRGEIKGVLLAVIQKEHSGILGLLSSRSIIWGGPLVKDDDVKVLDELLKLYIKKVQKKVIYTQFRNLWQWTNAEKEIFEKNGFSYEPHLNILVDISKDEEALWKEVNPKGRNKIKGAIKNGVTFEVKNDEASLKECYNILNEVYKRTKLPFPSYNFFLNLYTHSTPTQGLRLFTALFEGQIIGCRLGLVYKNSIYDFYAGAYSKYYSKHPNDLIPWEVFRWGKAHGYTHFDFGGAGKPNETYGVREHKSKFGGELVEYGRFVLVHKPTLLAFGKFLMKIYKFLK